MNSNDDGYIYAKPMRCFWRNSDASNDYYLIIKPEISILNINDIINEMIYLYYCNNF
jgi:hypothetical protein